MSAIVMEAESTTDESKSECNKPLVSKSDAPEAKKLKIESSKSRIESAVDDIGAEALESSELSTQGDYRETKSPESDDNEESSSGDDQVNDDGSASEEYHDSSGGGSDNSESQSSEYDSDAADTNSSSNGSDKEHDAGTFSNSNGESEDSSKETE